MKTNQNLQELFDKYINICQYTERRRPATIKSYEDAFRLFINLIPEVTQPYHLSEGKICEFFKKLETRERTVGKGTVRRGVKDSTIATYWSKLNSFFVWLKKEKHIDKNPLENIKKPNPDYSDKKALHKKELQRIYTAITLNSTSPLALARDTLIVSLLFFLGIRKTELISLNVQDVDFNDKTITIQGKTSKSKKTRRIPISVELMNHLKNYLKIRKSYKSERLLISTQRDSGITKYGIIHWVRRMNRLSGVKFHLHMFRHTFACNLVKNRISMIKLMMLMGHTDIRMTQRYLRSIDAEDLRDEISKMSINDAW